jgi:hypothetical protein
VYRQTLPIHFFRRSRRRVFRQVASSRQVGLNVTNPMSKIVVKAKLTDAVNNGLMYIRLMQGML